MITSELEKGDWVLLGDIYGELHLAIVADIFPKKTKVTFVYRFLLGQFEGHILVRSYGYGKHTHARHKIKKGA